jgi:hypothetical protein
MTAFILIGGGIFHPVFVPIGMAITFVVLVGWFWTARRAKKFPNRHPFIRRTYGRETEVS